MPQFPHGAVLPPNLPKSPAGIAALQGDTDSSGAGPQLSPQLSLCLLLALADWAGRELGEPLIPVVQWASGFGGKADPGSSCRLYLLLLLLAWLQMAWMPPVCKPAWDHLLGRSQAVGSGSSLPAGTRRGSGDPSPSLPKTMGVPTCSLDSSVTSLVSWASPKTGELGLLNLPLAHSPSLETPREAKTPLGTSQMGARDKEGGLCILGGRDGAGDHSGGLNRPECPSLTRKCG